MRAGAERSALRRALFAWALACALTAPASAEKADREKPINLEADRVTLDDAKQLLRAGIDGFAHGVRDRDVDDEFIALINTN